MKASSTTLSNSSLDYQYDAIVIGAGLTGLTAATSLARGGAHVLVCEQAAQAGGLFNSFWRGGYLFDGGIKAVENGIELCVTATPRTIATLTSNTQGAIMGWSYHRQRTLRRGNFLQLRSSVLTPVRRLLTAGHWSYSPGGSPVAVLTGKLAAEAVLRNEMQGGQP